MGVARFIFRLLKAVTTLARYGMAYARVRAGSTSLKEHALEKLQQRFSRLGNAAAGVRVTFNAEALATSHGAHNVLFIANHLSKLDPLVLGSVLHTTFAGKEEVLRWPTVKTMTDAVHFVPVKRQVRAIAETRGRLIRQLNAGHNLALFPQGTTSKAFTRFRHALLEILYPHKKSVDANNAHAALDPDRKVLVHPIAIQVKEEALDRYCDFFDRGLRSAFNMMASTGAEVTVTVLPALDPKEFKNAHALVQTAQRQIARIVAPGQTSFDDSDIPTLSNTGTPKNEKRY